MTRGLFDCEMDLSSCRSDHLDWSPLNRLTLGPSLFTSHPSHPSSTFDSTSNQRAISISIEIFSTCAPTLTVHCRPAPLPHLSVMSAGYWSFNGSPHHPHPFPQVTAVPCLFYSHLTRSWTSHYVLQTTGFCSCGTHQPRTVALTTDQGPAFPSYFTDPPHW